MITFIDGNTGIPFIKWTISGLIKEIKTRIVSAYNRTIPRIIGDAPKIRGAE